MASNPPFQVEDTDEDFFDKLVNDDDDDYNVASSSAAEHNSADTDSDETKAFANLSIGEGGTGFKDSGSSVSGIVDQVEGYDGDGKGLLSDVRLEESSSLVPSNSVGVDSVIESNDGGIGTETVSKSSGSGSSGVKEVQWSAFSTDLVQNNNNGFGSFSDFLTEFGESDADPFASIGNNANNESKIVSGSEIQNSAYLGNASNYVQQQEDHGYAATTEQSMDGQNLNSSEYWENQYPGWKFDVATGQWYQVDGYDAAATAQGSSDSNSAADWAVSDMKSEVSYLQQTANSVVGTVAENGTIESISNWNPVSQASYATESMLKWNQTSQARYITESAANWNEVPQGTLAESSMIESISNRNQVSRASYTSESVPNWNQDSQASHTTENVSNWNQVSQGNNGYPSNMIFDPQYPGWYFDTNIQDWRSLDTYQSSVQSWDQLNPIASSSTYEDNHQQSHTDYGQVSSYGSGGFSSQQQNNGWDGTPNNYNQQVNTWQPNTDSSSMANSEYGGTRQLNHSSNFSAVNHVNQQQPHNYGGTVPFSENSRQGHNAFPASSVSQAFVPGGDFSQQRNEQQSNQTHFSNNYYPNQNSFNYPQQPFQADHQFPYAPAAGRSSAGRPPHALVAFGFGGKLIVMKDGMTSTSSSYGSQDPVGGSISVLNLTEVVNDGTDASTAGAGVCDYFRTLCRQSFPGPLTGGNVGTKEVNKWIDERIVQRESPDMDYRKGEILCLLFSLLKIAFQHYGKFRSPFGSDTALKESDTPESAVARLFASAKRNGTQFNEYGALTHCLQKLPSEGEMLASAAEVQTLLVSGRKKEALHCAQEGQLWGYALLLASQLGDQFYIETVKQMALRQLVAGSPLRTLCLLIAGQPAAVFSAESTADSGIPNAVNMSQQPAQLGTNCMLDDWEENLAVITANRTKDDELVLIHLGDCLWKERSEIIAAHICYLVAEANFEPYSDSARLCLVGADHWKFPRTYASPEAIQRTEIYEYSKVLGNSQFTLLPFQPYKLLYAHMLAEVGRLSDSLKYCQAISKSLKTGRAPEVDTWRQLVSSLEERIRTHQQGGFSTNLAPAKLVGKLLNLFDSTAHRVVGSLPPPVPSQSMGTVQVNEIHYQPMAPRVSTSQSTMAMSSLMPSASMEPINERSTDGNRMTMYNRSVSEPDFGRSPRQVDPSKEATSANATQGKASTSGVTSRFGRFGFGSQLFQKTVGYLKPRSDKQAKLGDSNKFYYDEKLKRWVEEGAEPPAEESALPPPPTMAALSNGTSDYSLRGALKSEASLSNGSPEYKSPTSLGHSSGIPPIPPTSNQFSARGRMGVRSRYVDTFNQGGGNPTNLFQSPSVPPIKPTSSGNPKFFVPAPVSSVEDSVDSTAGGLQHDAAINENPSFTTMDDGFQSPAPPPMTMQRFASMGNIPNKGATMSGNGNGSLSSHSRRTASWSGSLGEAFSPPNRAETKPLGEVLGMPPSSFMPGESALTHSSMNGSSYGDDLHEVEL
ncbi:hypothetical protein RJ639_014438 [Escallonia herrerae]|uniref:Protein transport protein sec16 n=1 Tax=Escallonia herrerae TaxID=1293975 RepID=A0AA88VGV2_9ASTE|nr:hypothetical protein RJ639_014438 [Escallonia herrerae]